MTTGGWINMIVSVGFVVGLFAWCIWRVFHAPPNADHMHAPIDIDTKDRED